MKPDGKAFMLAVTDYFSKWIDVESFVQVRQKKLMSFIKRNILTMFGIPLEIICDNRSQFIGKRTQNICVSREIKMITSTLAYPQSNGQDESRNKSIINNLNKRLIERRGTWDEDLPLVFWADRTTTKNSTGQTPYSQVFGTKFHDSTGSYDSHSQTRIHNQEEHGNILAKDLDTVDDFRDLVNIWIATYQQIIAKSYNNNTRIRSFQIGDLVLQKVFQNTAKHSAEKLAPKWEGRYLIDLRAGKGAYWFSTLYVHLLPITWNTIHFKNYFV